MGYLEIALLAVALAADAFSMAAASAPAACRKWGALRMSAAFGLFQALMPLGGALAGAFLLRYVADYDHWVAFALLEIVGLKMIVDALRPGKKDAEQDASRPDPSTGWSLLALAVATSIDAFGAGISMGTAKTNLWIACPTIGIVCAALTYLGAKLGITAGKRFGRKAEIAGGVVLIALGIRMLWI